MYSRPAIGIEYTTDIAVKEAGTHTNSLKSTKGIFNKRSKRVKFKKHRGEIRLKKTDGEYAASGKVISKGILRRHLEYFEKANIEIDAEIPEGTSIDLYIRKNDPNGSAGVHARSQYWKKVTLERDYTLGSFLESFSVNKLNRLRWKAVLRTTDPSKTPVLKSVTVTYSNAQTSESSRVRIKSNRVLEKADSPELVTLRLKGYGFKNGKEEVYLKNLRAAESVRFINGRTLDATFDVSDLSIGSYTIAVRNTETGRVAVTDGDPILQDLYFGGIGDDVKDYRLLIKGDAPNIETVSTDTVSYADGSTFYIRGNNFSYGTHVLLGVAEIPDAAVTVVNDTLIQVVLSHAIIATENYETGTDLSLSVKTPDFQVANTTETIRIQ